MIKDFLKREAVLVISALLAVLGMSFAWPGAEALAACIDWGTLIVLYCLMIAASGLKEAGLLTAAAVRLLRGASSLRRVVCSLVFLCFFSSMFITNDVALITFVPLALMTFGMIGTSVRDTCLAVTLMTIAANLGSMFTPQGNPQNLYLYSVSGMALYDFLRLMLPYTLASGVMLACALAFIPRSPVSSDAAHGDVKLDGRKISLYTAVLCLGLMTVMRLLDPLLLFVLVLFIVAARDRRMLLRADFSLIATFIFLFIFIGCVGTVPSFADMVRSMTDGHVLRTSVITSQVISNVPAALLLSGFTDSWNELIVGTNLGGLGTLIASMASLISFKQMAAKYPREQMRYTAVFTLWNILFLAVLSACTCLGSF